MAVKALIIDAIDYVRKNRAAERAAGAGALAAGALTSQEAEAGPLAAGARRFLDDRFLNALGGSNPRVGLRDTVAGMETGVAERVMDKGRPLNLGDYEGHPYILTQSDRSAAGGEIVSVHSTDIDPVDLRGGRDFMFDAPSEGQVWASDPNVIKSLYNRAEALSRSHGKDTILLPYSMAPTGIDFATMPLDTMVGFARAKMSKANIKKLDKSIKAIIPEWGGVADPNSIGIFRDVKGPKRKQVADLIDKDFRGVPGGMSISEARAATTDAAQYMSPEGQIMNVGRINTRSPIITESGHPTYVGGLPGRGEGTLENTLDVRPFMANNGRQLTGDAADIRALSMNHGLSQGVLDDTLLNKLYGERGNATPAALAVTAGATGTGMALGGAGMLSASVPNAEGSTEEEPTFKEKFEAASKASIAPESEWAAEFSPSDFRYAETYRGEDSPTGKTITYINRKKLEDAGATDGYVDEIIFGEALHQLRDIDPERHKRLLDASRSEPEVMAWARDSYKRAQSEGEKRDFDSWWVNSRLDQVIGGYIQGGKNSSMPTMRGWDRDSLPYGTQFKGEIDNLMAALGRSFPADSSPEEVAPQRSMMDQISPYAEALGEAFGATSRFIANKNPYVTALASRIDVGKEWDKPMARMYGLGAALKVLANGGTFENALLRGSKVGGQSIDEIGQEMGKYVADKTGNPYAAAISKAIVQVASP
tara:strand:- start:142 stop:2262 length:2121 start_codon:yes stop_codon:yes gene_type:complete